MFIKYSNKGKDLFTMQTLFYDSHYSHVLYVNLICVHVPWIFEEKGYLLR